MNSIMCKLYFSDVKEKRDQPDAFDGTLPSGEASTSFLFLLKSSTVLHMPTEKLSFILKGLYLGNHGNTDFSFKKGRPPAFC